MRSESQQRLAFGNVANGRLVAPRRRALLCAQVSHGAARCRAPGGALILCTLVVFLGILFEFRLTWSSQHAARPSARRIAACDRPAASWTRAGVLWPVLQVRRAHLGSRADREAVRRADEEHGYTQQVRVLVFSRASL